MKHVEWNKLNNQMYALTCGPQTIPQMDQKISKKGMHLNYNMHKRNLLENGDISLQIMLVEEKCLTVDEIMDASLDQCSTLASNNFEYSSTANELIKNYVHPLFLRDKSSTSH